MSIIDNARNKIKFELKRSEVFNLGVSDQQNKRLSAEVAQLGFYEIKNYKLGYVASRKQEEKDQYYAKIEQLKQQERKNSMKKQHEKTTIKLKGLQIYDPF